MPKSPRQKVVLITGASTGLGLAMVREFLKHPEYLVIATARGESVPRFASQGLNESKYPQLRVRPLDLLSKENRDDIISETESKFGGIDILINNAGYSLRAVVEHVGEMERYMQVDTNFRAPFALIRKVLPTMREKRAGHIINISSVGGMMAMPTMAIYSASKFALEGASEALWYEVRPWNIRVTLVQPGFVRSDSFKRVKLSKESIKSQNDPTDPYYNHYNSMSEFIAKLMTFSPSTPEKVARKVFKLTKMRRPPLRAPGTLDAYLFILIRRILPRKIYHLLLYYSLPRVMRWGETKNNKKINK